MIARRLLILAIVGAAAGARPPLAGAQEALAEAPAVQVDLSSAQAERVLQPSGTFDLPRDEFPSSVVVDATHQRAYVATEFVAINIFSLLAAVWIEWLALASVAVVCWWLLRVVRRPQDPGQPYCRRCNYLLTNLAGEVCPECGARLTRRNRVTGRRRWPRVTVAAVLLVATVGLYIAGFERVPRLIWPDAWPGWWSQSLDDVAQANSKYRWLIQHSRVLSRLSEMDLTDGSARTVWIGSQAESDHIYRLFLSDDDEQLVVWTSESLHVRRPPGANAFQRLTHDGAGEIPVLAASLVEVSGDGRTAILIDEGADCRAQAVDLGTGATLWSEDHLVPAGLTNLRLLHGRGLDRFLIAGESPSTGVTDLSEFFVDGQHRVNRTRHMLTNAFSLGPRLARNGLGELIWASDLDSVEAWNLQTERVEKRLTLPERSVLLSAWPGEVPRLIITMFDQRSRTWLVDTESNRVLAELAAAPPNTRSAEVLSDGTTLAAWGYDIDLSHKVLSLYDVSGLANAGP